MQYKYDLSLAEEMPIIESTHTFVFPKQAVSCVCFRPTNNSIYSAYMYIYAAAVYSFVHLVFFFSFLLWCV